MFREDCSLGVQKWVKIDLLNREKKPSYVLSDEELISAIKNTGHCGTSTRILVFLVPTLVNFFLSHFVICITIREVTVSSNDVDWSNVLFQHYLPPWSNGLLYIESYIFRYLTVQLVKSCHSQKTRLSSSCNLSIVIKVKFLQKRALFNKKLILFGNAPS